MKKAVKKKKSNKKTQLTACVTLSSSARWGVGWELSTSWAPSLPLSCTPRYKTRAQASLFFPMALGPSQESLGL